MEVTEARVLGREFATSAAGMEPARALCLGFLDTHIEFLDDISLLETATAGPCVFLFTEVR